MRQHNGMRPQDVDILLKIISLEGQEWNISRLAKELHISSSEICEALNRCAFAGLMNKSKKKVMKMAFLDFLSYGLKYIFPVQPEQLVYGIPTAHSAPPLSNEIISNGISYVWKDANSKLSGLEIKPLYKNSILAVKDDSKFYEFLALVDALRVGKIREVNIAKNELKKRFNIEQPVFQTI